MSNIRSHESLRIVYVCTSFKTLLMPNLKKECHCGNIWSCGQTSRKWLGKHWCFVIFPSAVKQGNIFMKNIRMLKRLCLHES